MQQSNRGTMLLSGMLLVAIAGLPGAAALGPFTNPTGPLCANISWPLKAAMRAVPAPAADALCPDLLSGVVPVCDSGALLEHFLGATEELRCNPAGQVEPPGRPVAFRDRRPLPAGAFPNVAAIYREEGATHYWLYRVVQNLEAYLGCFIANNTPWAPPKGWNLLTMANVTEGTRVLPFAAVIQNAATRQVVVAIRGTQTGFEWAVDFTYNQTNAAAITAMFGSPMHDGFAGVWSQLWPAVRGALDSALPGASATRADVFVTGHSLGGAVATLMSFAVQRHLNARAPLRAPVVSAALFAPPNVGPPTFVTHFNALVNARRIAFEYDIVPQAFCTPQMPACQPGKQPGTLGALLWAEGITIIPTNMPGNVSAWSYAQIGGSLPIPANAMPMDTASWPALSNIQLCWAYQFLYATHICSYACWTQQFVPGGAAANASSCWLSQAPPGSAPGMQCPTWPSNYPNMLPGATIDILNSLSAPAPTFPSFIGRVPHESRTLAADASGSVWFLCDTSRPHTAPGQRCLSAVAQPSGALAAQVAGRAQFLPPIPVGSVIKLRLRLRGGRARVFVDGNPVLFAQGGRWEAAQTAYMRVASSNPRILLEFYRPAVAHTVYSLALDFADVYSSQFKVVRLLATSPF